MKNCKLNNFFMPRISNFLSIKNLILWDLIILYFSWYLANLLLQTYYIIFWNFCVGRFKRAIPFSHVYSGQVYETPLTHIPARLLVNAALKVMSRLQPAVQIHLSGKQPYFLSPLASTAQKISTCLTFRKSTYISEYDRCWHIK